MSLCLHAYMMASYIIMARIIALRIETLEVSVEDADDDDDGCAVTAANDSSLTLETDRDRYTKLHHQRHRMHE